MLSVMAQIELSGAWPASVDIRCAATEEDPACLSSPWMKGRHAVPLPNLVEQLQETLAERRQIIERARCGDFGPYVFERAVWRRVHLLNDQPWPWGE